MEHEYIAKSFVSSKIELVLQDETVLFLFQSHSGEETNQHKQSGGEWWSVAGDFFLFSEAKSYRVLNL